MSTRPVLLPARRRRAILVVVALVVALGLVPPAPVPASASAPCATSGPTVSSYAVTVCITTPAPGATVAGVSHVAASTSVTGSAPGVQNMRFYVDGAFTLTDYEAPYEFDLRTSDWANGNHSLTAVAVMRDGFASDAARVDATFDNASPTPAASPFTPTTGAPAAAGTPFLVAAAGDGASGESGAKAVTDAIASWSPNMVLYLGDVYEKGTPTEFENWYGSSSTFYGRFRPITNPAVGNHEYEHGEAPGYFGYWGDGSSYYSTNANGWHIIALNSTSEEDQDVSSPQYQWLAGDLAANATPCTIAFFHHPRFSVGPLGDTDRLDAMWKLMAANGVDLVLTGHDHGYQRWTPMNGNGAADPSGMTQFVAGTGGHGTTGFTATDSRVRSTFSEFGALRLELNASGAAYQFMTPAGAALDSGATPCRGMTDVSAPAKPSNVRARIEGTTVRLSWTASIDDVGTTGYDVYRDGALVATAQGVTSYEDAGDPQTTYQYTVRAKDAAGHTSAASDPVNATTTVAGALFSDGFEAGNLSKWTSAINMTVQGTDTLSGRSAVRSTSSGAASWAYTQLRRDQATLHLRARFKINSLGSTVNVLKLRTATGSSIIGAYVSSTGKLGVRNDVTSMSTTASFVVTTGAWHDLQIRAAVNGTAGEVQAWYDGTLVGALSKTDNLGTTPIGRVQIGDNSTGRSYDMVLDAVAADPSFIADATGPTLTTATADSSFVHRSGSTIFYNPSAGNNGTFTISADSTDAESGISSIVFPAIFGSDGRIDSSPPYTASYSWTSTATAQGDYTIVATNGSGLSTTSPLQLVRDTSPGTGGRIDYVDGFVRDEPVRVTLDEGTDTGSGIDSDSALLERAEADLAGGVCGTFGTFVSASDYPQLDFVDDTTSSGHCYRYRWTVPDRVGNRAVYTSGATVAVDALAPAGSVVVDGTTLSGTTTVGSTSSDDGGSGVSSIAYAISVAGANAWTGIGSATPGSETVALDTMQYGDGLYDLRATFRDRAGNMADATVEVSIRNGDSISLAIQSPRSYVASSDPDPFPVTVVSGDALTSVAFSVCASEGVTCDGDVWTSLGTDTTAPFSAPWTVPADGHYVLRAEGTDGSTTAADQATVEVDRTLPTGGSVTYTDGWNTTGSVAVATSAGIDAGSGIATTDLERDEALSSSAGCAAFADDWSAVGSPDASVVSGHCYRYRFVVTDRAGNRQTYTSTNVVKVDTIAPTAPVATATPASPTAVAVSWTASTDDLAVARYAIARNGVTLATVAGTASAWTDATASPATSYTYTVVGFDPAGNASPSSNTSTVTTPSTRITLQAARDAYVSAAKPATNYGSATTIRADADPALIGYVRFDVTGIAARVTRATLRIQAKSTSKVGVEVWTTDTAWAESTITYANAPARSAPVDATAGFSAGTWLDIDVTAAVTANGAAAFALTEAGTTAMSFASRESGAPPQLIIETEATT